MSWTDNDTKNETGDSAKDVARAGHDHRDDATKAGVFERGNDEKNSKAFQADEKDSGLWKSLFG